MRTNLSVLRAAQSPFQSFNLSTFLPSSRSGMSSSAVHQSHTRVAQLPIVTYKIPFETPALPPILVDVLDLPWCSTAVQAGVPSSAETAPRRHDVCSYMRFQNEPIPVQHSRDTVGCRSTLYPLINSSATPESGPSILRAASRKNAILCTTNG